MFTSAKRLADLPQVALGRVPKDTSETSTQILRKEEGPGPSNQPQVADNSSDDSTNRSLLQHPVFDEESQHWGAFSSTLPTSHKTSKPEAEGQASKLVNLDSRDSYTIYSIDFTPEDSDYILLFAERLKQDLKNQSGLANLSEIPSSFINNALGAFTWKLYEESTNPFQWETSTILHQKTK